MGTASKKTFSRCLLCMSKREEALPAGMRGRKRRAIFPPPSCAGAKKSDPSLSLIAGPAQTRSVAAFMYTTVDKTKEWSGVEGAKKGKRAF